LGLPFSPILASYNPKIPSASTPSGSPTPSPPSCEPTAFAFGQLVCVGHALALVEQGGQENSPVSKGFTVAVVVTALENGSLKEIVELLKQFVSFTWLTFSSRAKIMSTHYFTLSVMNFCTTKLSSKLKSYYGEKEEVQKHTLYNPAPLLDNSTTCIVAKSPTLTPNASGTDTCGKQNIPG
jgi:hypothetical protein